MQNVDINVANFGLSQQLKKLLKDFNLSPTVTEFFDGFSPRHCDLLLDQISDFLDRSIRCQDRALDLRLQITNMNDRIRQLDLEQQVLQFRIDNGSTKIDLHRANISSTEKKVTKEVAQAKVTNFEDLKVYFYGGSEGGQFIESCQLAAVTAIPPRDAPGRPVDLTWDTPWVDQVGGTLPRFTPNRGRMEMYRRSLEEQNVYRIKLDGKRNEMDQGISRIEVQGIDGTAESEKKLIEAIVKEDEAEAFRNRKLLESVEWLRKQVTSDHLDMERQIGLVVQRGAMDLYEARRRMSAVAFGANLIYGVKSGAILEEMSVEDCIAWARDCTTKILRTRQGAKTGLFLQEVTLVDGKAEFDLIASEWLPDKAMIQSISSWHHLDLKTSVTLKIIPPEQYALKLIEPYPLSKKFTDPPVLPNYKKFKPTWIVGPICNERSNIQCEQWTDSNIINTSPFGQWNVEGGPEFETAPFSLTLAVHWVIFHQEVSD